MPDLFDFAGARPTAHPAPPHAALAMRVIRVLAERLARRHPITRQYLTAAMNEAFGGSDADGAWTPREAYDCAEAAAVLELRRIAPLVNPNSRNPRQALAQLRAIEEMLPLQTRRTEDTILFQQFSTPPVLGWLAARALSLGPGDTVLEPSAGTGLLAVMAEVTGARVVVNEIAEFRYDILEEIFADVHAADALYLSSILPKTVEPTAILMNPPFTSDVNRDGRGSSDVGLGHLREAALRLAPEGRLAAILGANTDPLGARKDAFGKIAELTGAGLLASLSFSGSLYRRFGTDFDIRLVVLEKTTGATYRPVTGSFDAPEAALDAIDALLGPELVEGSKSVVLSPSKGRRPAARPHPEPVERPLAALPAALHRQNIGAPAAPDPPKTPPRAPARMLRRARHGALKGTPSLEPFEPIRYDVVAACDGDIPFRNAIYEPYRPARLALPGALPHPAPLVESAALASVAPPEPVYVPALPPRLITQGLISIAQFESIVYAGQAHGNFLATRPEREEDARKPLTARKEAPPLPYRQGFFIGDGTGFGKGVEICTSILESWQRGQSKAAWFSESADLLAACRRDWSWLGRRASEVFQLNETPPERAIPHDYGILFATYATLRSASGKTGKTRVDQIVDWLGDDFDGILVLDECHGLSHAVAAKDERGRNEASQQGIAALELQRLLPSARVLYTSATGATEIAALAYAPRLGLWGGDTEFSSREDFVCEISKGGICALEAVAQDLKALGLYTARNLSFDGVTYGQLVHELTPEQIALYDDFADAWALVLRNLEQALELTKIVDENGKALNPQAKNTRLSQFWAANQRFWNQVITALMLPTVIAEIERRLAQGDAVLLQLTNTQAANTERALARLDQTQDLEDLDTTPREILMDYTLRLFPTIQHGVYDDDDGNTRSTPIVIDGHTVENPAALAMKRDLLERLSLLRIPNGPLEILLDHFGAENLAEITGRRRRIVKKTIDGVMKHVLETRPQNANLAETALWDNDEKRILVFSQAGSTGRSYHADRRIKNRRRRIHMLLQPGWRSEIAIQGLGRSHRTNQTSAPHYVLCTTTLAGHRRFVSTIARRLDQLGAITRGMRQTGSQNLFTSADNLENAYARLALDHLLNDIRARRVPDFPPERFAEETGLAILGKSDNALAKPVPVTQFLNRLLSLKVARQTLLFREFEDRLLANIERAVAEGSYDKGIETIDAESLFVTAEKEIHAHPKTGAKTSLVTVRAERRIPYIPFEEALALAEKRPGFRFAQNTRSNHVAAVHEIRSITDAEGRTSPRVRLIRPTGTQIVPLEEHSRSHWKPVPAPDAEKLWKAEIERAPKTRTLDLHIATGALLPIWKRLPREHMRIYRMHTDDGRRILGRVIDDTEIPELLEKLGHDIGDRRAPERLIAHLAAGGRIALDNGWLLKLARLNDQTRIEIARVCEPWRHAPTLKRIGAIHEIIEYAPRFFIPNGNREAVIARLLEITRPERFITARQAA